MAFTVEVSLDLEVTPETAFDTLADHASWPAWMPRSFLPLGPSVGTLRPGATPRVRITGLPTASTLHVTVVDRPRSIIWTGGVRGVLTGEHAFHFAPHGAGTTVRSVEVWSGALSWVLRPILARGAARVGLAQLKGLRRGALARVGSSPQEPDGPKP